MNISPRKEGSFLFKYYTSSGEELIVRPTKYCRLFIPEYDLLRIGSAFFELERKLIEERKIIRHVEIPITGYTYRKINAEKVLRILNELTLFLFGRSISFCLIPFQSFQRKIDDINKQYDSICLFSGGADSLVGVLEAKKRTNQILALYISHEKSNRLQQFITNLKAELLDVEKIDLKYIDVNSQIKKGYSQSRGLLYILCGGVYAFIHNSEVLILSECGTTIYQPSFGELDKTTYTSHPLIQERCKELIKIFLNKDLKIETPFENSTKAEMFALLRRKDLLKCTHSCITSRFGINEGTCYGCIIRRVGSIVAGVNDYNYPNDIFTLRDEDDLKVVTKKGATKVIAHGAGQAKIDDFLELMKFSLYILVWYDDIEYSKKKKIETYGKYDLFRRFALDTFSALYILIEQQDVDVNQRIKNRYFDALNYIDKQELERRIVEVRSLTLLASNNWTYDFVTTSSKFQLTEKQN